jgi:hypothetical protein
MKNSDDEGDHNPPKESLEILHKLLVISKIKRKINQEGKNEVELEYKITLEEMDLDANIEEVEYSNEEQRV